MIKKIRFEITPKSYGEMAHLEFFKDNVALKVNTTAKTLTLTNGDIIKITPTASSQYNNTGYAVTQVFNASGSDHTQACWCSATTGSQCFVELDFEPAVSKDFADKITFCCGQGHGTYPATFSLFFINENGKSEQIGTPLYVDAHNGIFEWSSTIKCLRGKDNNKLYFLTPKTK